MATGKVKWFNDQKGYGFIQPDEGGSDIFVHISAVERSGLKELKEDQKVSYELYTDQRRNRPAQWTLKSSKRQVIALNKPGHRAGLFVRRHRPGWARAISRRWRCPIPCAWRSLRPGLGRSSLCRSSKHPGGRNRGPKQQRQAASRNSQSA